jgi:hypothetical protein
MSRDIKQWNTKINKEKYNQASISKLWSNKSKSATYNPSDKIKTQLITATSTTPLTDKLLQGNISTYTENNDSEQSSIDDNDTHPLEQPEEPSTIPKDSKKHESKTKKFSQLKLHTDTNSNLTYGDNVFDEPEHKIILFHNINGMKNDNNWFQIITTMQELNITIFGFAKLNQTLTRSYNSKWKETLRKIFYYSQTNFAKSSITLESKYKPGGTMTTVTGKWQSRVSEQGQDSQGLGRWNYQKISSKKNSIVIITAYQPCKSAGPSTTWMQQWVLLRESGHSNPNPIKLFYNDLEEVLIKWCNSGHEIILMIDAGPS